MILTATDENIAKAAQLITSGEVIAFPTETVYGLGANALNPTAVKSIFELKQRPSYNPLIVHLAEPAQIQTIADTSEPGLENRIKRLAALWPGPLSIVLPKRPELPGVVTGGKESVAIRIPRHPVAQRLLRKAQVPIAAPSANRFSSVSPTCAEHVAHAFGEDLAYILDGGACEIGLESTVVSLLSTPAVLLRPGAVTLEQLREALDEDVLIAAPKPSGSALDSSQILSPGMLARHYAPRTPVALVSKVEMSRLPKRVGYIGFAAGSNAPQSSFAAAINLSKTGDLHEVAANLYRALHELDDMGLDLILVDSCEEHGLGRAIMDRLQRASTPG